MQDNQTNQYTNSDQVSSQKPVSDKFSGLAIAGLVLGIIALIGSWVPILNNVAFFIGLIGFILCLIAAVSTFRNRKRGKALSIISSLICIIAMILVLTTQGVYSTAIDEAVSGSDVVTIVES